MALVAAVTLVVVAVAGVVAVVAVDHSRRPCSSRRRGPATRWSTTTSASASCCRAARVRAAGQGAATGGCARDASPRGDALPHWRAQDSFGAARVCVQRFLSHTAHRGSSLPRPHVARVRADSCCHVAATRDEISEDEEGSTGTTARRNHAWSLQVRELVEFSRYVEQGSNPFSRAIVNRSPKSPHHFPHHLGGAAEISARDESEAFPSERAVPLRLRGQVQALLLPEGMVRISGIG